MSIKKILESAILAPSGDNCQPWKLVVENNKIHIFNLPEKDTSLFNFHQKASLVAHGALIENIMISTSALGYTANLKLFPDKRDADFIATVELVIKSDIVDEPLYPYITQRSTNRKQYRPIPLTVEERISLQNTSRHFSNGGVRFIEEPQEKAVLAEVIGMNDRLVFENQKLHSFLFEHIRWTEREAQKTRNGLYIKTLELPPPQTIGFRLLRNWSLLQILNPFGLSKVVAKQAEKLCLSASAIGGIIVDTNTEEDFLMGGRLLQRVWLEATKLGLSFQPMTGITFLIQKVLAGDEKDISPAHVKLVKYVHERIKAAFRLRNETIVVLFRIGHSAHPSARSLRLAVDNVVHTG